MLRGWDLPSSAAFIAIGLIAAVLLRLIANAIPSKRPPVFEGLPFIGGLLQFAQGPMRLIGNGYKRCGEVFTVPVLHKKFTFLVGPHVSEPFFKLGDDVLSQQEVYQFNVPTFGPGVVFDVDHKIRAEQFRFFAEALKTSKLQEYVPHFVRESQEYFARWGEEGVVDLAKEFADLIILTASRTLLGREVRESMFEEVANLYHDLDQGMLPISVLFPYLPIPAHSRRDKARLELAKIFSRVVQARRASGVKEDDILQVFIDSKYRAAYGGRATNDEEITGFLIATLFAGQHTSSITTTWTGLEMITHKEHWAAAVDEQRRVMQAHGDTISMDALNSLSCLHGCMTEALRLFPPLILLMRQVKRSFTVTTSQGRQHVIPKGHVVCTSPAYSHMLENVFERPANFEPERFAKREEDKKLPFSFIGFGGGRHGCMGSNYAYLQVKTIWSILLRNFEFELVDPFPKPDYDAMVVGPKPCRVRYRRRKLQA